MDTDGDDEDFVYYGTPIEPEEEAVRAVGRSKAVVAGSKEVATTRSLPVHKQEVRGRRILRHFLACCVCFRASTAAPAPRRLARRSRCFPRPGDGRAGTTALSRRLYGRLQRRILQHGWQQGEWCREWRGKAQLGARGGRAGEGALARLVTQTPLHNAAAAAPQVKFTFVILAANRRPLSARASCT